MGGNEAVFQILQARYRAGTSRCFAVNKNIMPTELCIFQSSVTTPNFRILHRLAPVSVPLQNPILFPFCF
jgi:hypothetical protein